MLASSTSSTAIFRLAFLFLCAKNAVTMPCNILEPDGLVNISPYFLRKISTISAVVIVLPLVPVTITVS